MSLGFPRGDDDEFLFMNVYGKTVSYVDLVTESIVKTCLLLYIIHLILSF